MRHSLTAPASLVLIAAILAGLPAPGASLAADHNDPDAVNSIYSDIDVSPADLYDLFGFPGASTSGEETVVIALTFASIPREGVLDPDLLYRIRIYPSQRLAGASGGEESLDAVLEFFDAVKDKYLHARPAEARVTVDPGGRATVSFLGFPSGAFSQVIDTNAVTLIDGPRGHSIKAFVGGRDDAFFNDLPGFFRSINYAPQFYHVPHAAAQTRELPIPKTLIELEGNALFNFDPARPDHGSGVKENLPAGTPGWNGDRFLKDTGGNYRFVYSGRDAQAGININAIVLELPLSFITTSPETDRIVNTWGESWVLKAAHKVETIPDDRPRPRRPFWVERPWALPIVAIVLGALLLLFGPGAPGVRRRLALAAGLLLALGGVAAGLIVSRLGQASDPPGVAPDEQLARYKLVDTDGQPFADAALNERADERQVGADNFFLGRHLITRLAHLGWGFGPSITALGLETSFDHDDAPVSVHKTYTLATEAFPRVKKTLFQRLRMPDDSWNRRGLDIPLRRPLEIFVPNVCAIDMDTTGTWPFGRRLEDQVATRFLAMFLDMTAEIGGRKYDLEVLNQQSLWDQAAIEPKTPPNPRGNDKPFLAEFPYLAEPW